MLEQRPDSVDEQALGRDRTARPARPCGRRCAASSRRRYSCLYQSGSSGCAAALADPLGELDHLVDRLLAVEAHDVVEDHAADVGLGLARQPRQGLDEHRHHDLGPSLADQRERAVEVEQDVADLRARLEAERAIRRWAICCRFSKVVSRRQSTASSRTRSS